MVNGYSFPSRLYADITLLVRDGDYKRGELTAEELGFEAGTVVEERAETTYTLC